MATYYCEDICARISYSPRDRKRPGSELDLMTPSTIAPLSGWLDIQASSSIFPLRLEYPMREAHRYSGEGVLEANPYSHDSHHSCAPSEKQYSGNSIPYAWSFVDISKLPTSLTQEAISAGRGMKSDGTLTFSTRRPALDRTRRRRNISRISDESPWQSMVERSGHERIPEGPGESACWKFRARSPPPRMNPCRSSRCLSARRNGIFRW